MTELIGKNTGINTITLYFKSQTGYHAINAVTMSNLEFMGVKEMKHQEFLDLQYGWLLKNKQQSSNTTYNVER
jgi:hypothetical protein